jgi:hypothetical protein
MCIFLDQNLKIAVTVIAISLVALSVLGYVLISILFPLFQQTITPITNPQPMVSSARNWAGYVVATDLANPSPTVIGVSASWIVPSVTDIGTDAYSAVWVGIGGEFDQTLIQVGTEQDFFSGQPYYSAWYEMLPSNAVTIDSITVSPGDQMAASIKIVNQNSNLWSISLTDISTNQNFTINSFYSSQQLSAEWIVERPEVNNVLTELANFGNVSFTNCQATFNANSGSISDYANTQIVMDQQIRHNQLTPLVNVSTPTNQGTKFTVTYIG